MWEIMEGQNYAIYYPELMVVLEPAHHLELSWMFQIKSWVRSAFKQLVKLELRNLTTANINSIGFTTYVILAKACERINYEHKLLVAVPPKLDFQESYLCQSHETCKDVCAKLWWKRLGKLRLHPSRLLGLGSTLSYLETLKHDGIDNGCKMDMMAQLYTTSQADMFKVEEDIIMAAVRAVINYNKSL